MCELGIVSLRDGWMKWAWSESECPAVRAACTRPPPLPPPLAWACRRSCRSGARRWCASRRVAPLGAGTRAAACPQPDGTPSPRTLQEWDQEYYNEILM